MVIFRKFINKLSVYIVKEMLREVKVIYRNVQKWGREVRRERNNEEKRGREESIEKEEEENGRRGGWGGENGSNCGDSQIYNSKCCCDRYIIVSGRSEFYSNKRGLDYL